MPMKLIHFSTDVDYIFISHRWGKGAAIVEDFILRLERDEIRDLEKIIHFYNDEHKGKIDDGGTNRF